MQQPIQITFKGRDQTEELVNLIHKKAHKLQQFFDKIISCHIIVEQIKSHQQQNNIHINLNIPGKEFVVTKKKDKNIHIALRNAFDSLQQQLESYTKKTLLEIKSHADIIYGKIVRLFKDFGFIEGTNGSEYYFNASSLTHTQFSYLAVGNTVHFTEAVGDNGLQAHHIIVSSND